MSRAQKIQMSDNTRAGSALGADVLGALTRASDIFKQSLADDLPTMAFLKDRCGLSNDVIQEYGVGVSDYESWKHIDTKDVSLLALAGIAKPAKANSARSQWRERDVLLPVRDRRSRTVGFMVQPISEPGISMKASHSTGDSAILRSNYAVFGLDLALQAIQVDQPIVLVSSALEVLYLARNEIRGAVAPLNLPFSSNVLETLQGYSREIIIVCPGNKEMVVSALDAVIATLLDVSSVQFAFIPRESRNCVEFMQFKGADAFVDILERSTSTVELLYRRLITNPEVPATNKAQWVVDRGRECMKSNPSEAVRETILEKLSELAGLERQTSPLSVVSATPSSVLMLEPVAESDRMKTPVEEKKRAHAERVSTGEKALTTKSAPVVSKTTKPAIAPLPESRKALTVPWIVKLLTSAIYQHQRSEAGRMAPDDELMKLALSTLHGNGDRLTVARLASELKIPAFRGRGLVTGLRRVLNIDGIAILTLEESTGTVILDQASLRRHFNVGEQ